MRIKCVHVKSFRSIQDESIDCDSLTALVGRNGSGKSSFLSALELFYEPSGRVKVEDFFTEDVANDIEVAITFTDLSQEARELFARYIDNDDLTVTRVFSDPQLGKPSSYHGTRLQNPEFLEVRNVGGKRDIIKKYKELREKGAYPSLPVANSADTVLAALTEWESQNPTKCSRERDNEQFFGFTGVGRGYLGRHTRFIHIPAVRDASEDAIEKRGSSVTEIMDLVVRSALGKRQDLAEFEQSTQERYKEIMNPQNLSELRDLEQVLSSTLQAYVPAAGVLLQWSEFPDITIPRPEAQVKLREDDYESRVERTGHGLQRAFIVTMLQHLVAARVPESTGDDTASSDDNQVPVTELKLPSLVLAIEEPELYQHPSSQRHLASVLLKLATGAIPGVAQNTQVIYTTHSPLFVGLDRFNQIRVLRKTSFIEGHSKATRVKKADMREVANQIQKARGVTQKEFSEDTLMPRLQALMTPWMNEGFFADLVVLVEGEGDRAAILGAAHSMNHDLDAMGITVIPCFGKSNLDRPLVIFRQLDIPVYVVWDGDYNVKDSRPEDNRYLLRLLGEAEQDWPEFVGNASACFKINIEKTLECEIGTDLFNQLLNEAREDLEIVKKDQALKNPVVIQRVLSKATIKGKSSLSLTSIVENVVALKTQAMTSTIFPYGAND